MFSIKKKILILNCLQKIAPVSISLFTNKRFMLDEMAEQNVSKFVIFLEYENPRIFLFVFHFELLYFFPNECPGLCRHRRSLGGKINVHEMKNEKNYVGFCIPKI